MNESAKKKIKLVLKTLDSISVSGKNNHDMLLGCMLTLEQVLDEKQEVENAESMDGC